MSIPESDRTLLGVADVAGELLDDWRWLLGTLRARFLTGDFATGLQLVQKIAASAEKSDHHPDVDLRYPFVEVVLRSHDVDGVTQRDVRLAREISGHAQSLGVAADPASLHVLELALDVPDLDDVRPFWAAVLGLDTSADNDARDPGGILPTVWFQQADGATGETQQRWHLDVVVAHETVERRIAAALEAGGTLVSDARAPAFWVLADAHGNQACLCTPLGRD